jgi:uncharacterized membrane protein YkgB
MTRDGPTLPNDNGKMDPERARLEGVVIAEIQLILAEKRTSLAALRTGIAVFVLPLSVLSILISTSKYYKLAEVMHFLAPLLVLCVALVILGGYLVIRSMLRIRNQDRMILSIKKKHGCVAEFIDQ